jgi:hypothetical protein
MAANTVKGNATGSSAAPTDVTPLTARSSALLNVESATGRGDAIYTILATDRLVYTNAAFTVARIWTLPAANAVNAGTHLYIIDQQGTLTSTKTLSIARAGSDTINGGTASVVLGEAFSILELISDGTSKWTTLQKVTPYNTYYTKNFVSVADKQVVNTLTETSLKAATIAPTGGDVLPANFLTVGKTLRVKVWCNYSTTTGSNNCTWKLKLGSVVLITSSFNGFTASLTNQPYTVEFLIVCRSIGASGTVVSQGMSMSGEASIKSSGNFQNLSTTTIDTTTTQTLDLTVTWNIANAANQITCQMMICETF